MTTALINIRSLSKNIDLLKQYINLHNHDIYALTETWLNINDTCTTTSIEDQTYKLTSSPRLHSFRGHGGGVALLTKNHITIISNKRLQSTDSDIILTVLLINNIILHVIVCYRPPDNPYKQFFVDFTDIIHGLYDKNLLILGDFNFHFDSNINPHNDFQRLCSDINLNQHVSTPTHKHGHTIDLYLTKSNSNLIISCPKQSTLLTDHYVITSQLDLTAKSTPKPKLLAHRKIKNIDYVAFRTDIMNLILVLKANTESL